MSRGERRRFVAAVAGAWALSGCTMSIPGFIDAAPTGSIRPATYPFAQEDWTKAEPALLAAIAASPGDQAAAWSNPDSGRRGAVVGVGTRFARGGATCRAFVARVAEGEDSKLAQGSACEKAGKATISDAGPLQKV